MIRKREDINDPDEWRAQIKRQARADRIKVRTGAKDRFVYAVLAEGATAARLDEGNRWGKRHVDPSARPPARSAALVVAGAVGSLVIVLDAGHLRERVADRGLGVRCADDELALQRLHDIDV